MPLRESKEFDRDNDENYHSESAHRTAASAFDKLKIRYASQNLRDLLINLCSEIDHHLVAETQQNQKYHVAARALHPQHGRVGSRPRLFEIVLYVLAACKDETIVLSSTQDRMGAFYRALFEIQRGHNLRAPGQARASQIPLLFGVVGHDPNDRNRRNTNVVNYIDDGSLRDIPICVGGGLTKLAEVMFGLHPDFEQFVAGVGDTMVDILRGFVAEKFYAQANAAEVYIAWQAVQQDEATGAQRRQVEAFFNGLDKRALKQQVLASFDRDKINHQQRRHLDQYLEYLTQIEIPPLTHPQSNRSATILIANAKSTFQAAHRRRQQLALQEEKPAGRPRRPLSGREVEQLQAVIYNMLPAPELPTPQQIEAQVVRDRAAEIRAFRRRILR